MSTLTTGHPGEWLTPGLGPSWRTGRWEEGLWAACTGLSASERSGSKAGLTGAAAAQNGEQLWGNMVQTGGGPNTSQWLLEVQGTGFLTGHLLIITISTAFTIATTESPSLPHALTVGGSRPLTAQKHLRTPFHFLLAGTADPEGGGCSESGPLAGNEASAPRCSPRHSRASRRKRRGPQGLPPAADPEGSLQCRPLLSPATLRARPARLRQLSITLRPERPPSDSVRAHSGLWVPTSAGGNWSVSLTLMFPSHLSLLLPSFPS